MKKIHFYMVVHAFVLAALGAIPAYKMYQQSHGHSCKIESVEVTKTEGDLTWTTFEPMEVCK